MRGYRWWILTILLTVWVPACAPQQIRPVAEIDPLPFLESVASRRTELEQGLSGSLELSYKNSKQRFSGKAYVVAYPDGRFRIEVAGPLGGTFLVMTSDRSQILAYYPNDNRAFKSTAGGRSLSPHLPFPLPVDPGVLPALILGVLPEDDTVTSARAYLLDSGEKILRVKTGPTGLQFTYLFDKASRTRLRRIEARGRDLEVTVNTGRGAGHRLQDFTLDLADGTLRGDWDSTSPFLGDAADLALHLPSSVPITDLEATP